MAKKTTNHLPKGLRYVFFALAAFLMITIIGVTMTASNNGRNALSSRAAEVEPTIAPYECIDEQGVYKLAQAAYTTLTDAVPLCKNMLTAAGECAQCSTQYNCFSDKSKGSLCYRNCFAAGKSCNRRDNLIARYSNSVPNLPVGNLAPPKTCDKLSKFAGSDLKPYQDELNRIAADYDRCIAGVEGSGEPSPLVSVAPEVTLSPSQTQLPSCASLGGVCTTTSPSNASPFYVVAQAQCPTAGYNCFVPHAYSTPGVNSCWSSPLLACNPGYHCSASSGECVANTPTSTKTGKAGRGSNVNPEDCIGPADPQQCAGGGERQCKYLYNKVLLTCDISCTGACRY
jgi:hypothetical protein